MTTAETVVGVIEAKNERGIRVLGEWRNLSKFRPLELPEVGTSVSLALDSKGFINSLVVLESSDTPTTSGTRDQVITRLAVLKAAATFASTRPTVKAVDVLTVAQAWLEWIEPSPQDDYRRLGTPGEGEPT
jgi:hypothetical protein